MATERENCGKQVSIIGTGDYGRAMAIRLVNFGYDVTLGCRDPQNRGNLANIHKNLEQCRLVSIEKAIMISDVIFLCIHSKHHDTITEYDSLLRGKTLIDVSNPKRATKGDAIAIKLADKLPGCKVVKAFNTVSAYSIESSTSGETSTVHVAGDCPASRQRVICIARDIGFQATDYGGLRGAKELERSTVSLMQGWGYPTIVATIVWSVWCIYGVSRYMKIKPNPYGWERLASNVVNKVFACTAITLLSSCYMAGSFAAFFQLCYGTKHRRFPRGLDLWLKMRKQLGLWAFFNAIVHMILSASLQNPAYFSKWYLDNKVEIPVGNTTITIPGVARMNAKGEVFLLLGVLSISLMAMLAVTSLPSVSKTLNWREWTFVQSHVGYLALFLGMAHVTFMGAISWVNKNPADFVQGMKFLSSIPAWFALALKLILLLPCFSIRLNKIRSGWVKPTSVEVETIKATDNNKSKGHIVQVYDNDGFSEIKAAHIIMPCNGDIKMAAVPIDDKQRATEKTAKTL